MKETLEQKQEREQIIASAIKTYQAILRVDEYNKREEEKKRSEQGKVPEHVPK